MSFERGRQIRNPRRSNARFKLSCPFKVANYKMAFDVYEQLKLAEFHKEKLSNTKLAKIVDLKVESQTKDEAYDRAYEARQISGAVSRKKKIATDAIANVANGIFP